MKVKKQVKKNSSNSNSLSAMVGGTLLVFILLGQYKALFSEPSLHRKEILGMRGQKCLEC